MNISFFAKPAQFFGHSLPGGPHLYRGSSLVRGEQIAEYLGAKYNPKSGYENDICIYVKPDNLDLEKIKAGSYVDIVDGHYLIEGYRKKGHAIRGLRHYPKLRIITSSLSGYEFLQTKKLQERVQNEIVLVPEHHCNFERQKRQREEISTVGFIGIPAGFNYSVDEVKKRLEDVGLEFITNFTFKNRQDVTDFYKQIDIQIVWSVGRRAVNNPLKIINAASFGIPTIAYQQIDYKEFEGNYIAVKTMDSLIAEAEKLKDKNYYNQWANKIIEPAEKYHISKIAELYKQLL